MTRPLRTLSSLALPLSDEIQVRVLLGAIADETAAEWRCVDDMDAHLAICDPTSAMSQLLLRHAAERGYPLCVALSEDGAAPVGYRLALRRPLSVVALRGLLDEVATLASANIPAAVAVSAPVAATAVPAAHFIASLAGIDPADTVQDPPDAASPAPRVEQSPAVAAAASDAAARPVAASAPNPIAAVRREATALEAGLADCAGLPLVDVLPRVMDVGDGRESVWLVEIGGFELQLLMPERRFVMREQHLGLDGVVQLALDTPVDAVRRGGEDMRSALRRLAIMKSVDQLLWRIGMRMVNGPAQAWVDSNIHVRLKRWPDFGRLGMHKPQLVMTAQLTRMPMTMTSLVQASGQPLHEAIRFLNACAVCGLLETRSAGEVAAAAATAAIAADAAPMASPAVSPAPVRRGAMAGLFRSLRSALGIGE